MQRISNGTTVTEGLRWTDAGQRVVWNTLRRDGAGGASVSEVAVDQHLQIQMSSSIASKPQLVVSSTKGYN